MAIREWIQKGSISDELAEQRGLVELVRCKYCKYGRTAVSAYADMYCERLGRCVTADWFCADGGEISNAVENVC